MPTQNRRKRQRALSKTVPARTRESPPLRRPQPPLRRATMSQAASQETTPANNLAALTDSTAWQDYTGDLSQEIFTKATKEIMAFDVKYCNLNMDPTADNDLHIHAPKSSTIEPDMPAYVDDRYTVDRAWVAAIGN